MFNTSVFSVLFLTKPITILKLSISLTKVPYVIYVSYPKPYFYPNVKTTVETSTVTCIAVLSIEKFTSTNICLYLHIYSW